MLVPGDPMEGDAVNVRRFGGLRVVVVVLDGFDEVLVTAWVVDVDAWVVVVVGAVVVWACATQPPVSARLAPTRTPKTNWARRVTLISHLRRSPEHATQAQGRRRGR